MLAADADKRAYDKYYELLLQLVRPGGLIAIDNTLFYGRVVQPEVSPHAITHRRLLRQGHSTDSQGGAGGAFDANEAAKASASGLLIRPHAQVLAGLRLQQTAMLRSGSPALPCSKKPKKCPETHCTLPTSMTHAEFEVIWTRSARPPCHQPARCSVAVYTFGILCSRCIPVVVDTHSLLLTTFPTTEGE